ncbi:MAG: hypothetical protein RQ899_09755 [Pseudomonadales bacterium]|nr:hypothetical protein [Pseudomonadales bacterium]
MTATSATASTLQPERTRSLRLSFFFWMTLLMAGFVFTGFGMTYWLPLARGSFPPAPPVVHLHGLVFSCWMILLVVQAWLVKVRNITLHRSLGTFGIALATAVIFMGALITLLSGAANRDTPGPNYYDGTYLGIMAVLGFGVLFTLAIRTVRTPAVHKRMMLFALLPLLPPGIHRVYMVPLGLSTFPLLPMYLTLDAMAVAILVHEWRQNGRIGLYSIIGAGWIVLQQALHYPLTHSPAFADFLYVLTGMMHYR